MATTKETNGPEVLELSPPTTKALEVKDRFSLVLEVLWLHLLILPCMLLDLYRKIFPAPGKSLKGQVVLVTGSGRGLGRGLALEFAREGCKVAVADINKDNAEGTAKEIVQLGGVAKAFFANVAKVEDVRALREAVTKDLGPVDILVNNAGLIMGCSLGDMSEMEVKGMLSVNLASHFWMAQEFLPSMSERNSGHIVAISSMAAYCGLAKGIAYTATKYGVRGFMEALRAELNAKPNNNIKTTTVFPYFINTSAEYVNHWDLRIPPMTIEEAAKASVAGVKQEQVYVTIPGFLYSIVHIGRLLPQYVYDKFWDVFYVRIISPTKELQTKTPNYAIAKDSCL